MTAVITPIENAELRMQDSGGAAVTAETFLNGGSRMTPESFLNGKVQLYCGDCRDLFCGLGGLSRYIAATFRPQILGELTAVMAARGWVP